MTNYEQLQHRITCTYICSVNQASFSHDLPTVARRVWYRSGKHGRHGAGHAHAAGGAAGEISRETARTGETSASQQFRVSSASVYIIIPQSSCCTHLC